MLSTLQRQQPLVSNPREFLVGDNPLLAQASSAGTLTGVHAAQAAPLADHLLEVPSRSTPRIQEAHLFILHILAGRLETGSG